MLESSLLLRETKESHDLTFRFTELDILKRNQRVTTGELEVDGLRITHFIAHDKLENDSNEGTQYLKDDTLKFRGSASYIIVPLA